MISGAAGLLAGTGEFRNSRGMVFHAVPGTDVRFSIWETRLADWNAYLSSAGVSWDHRPGFPQDESHPVVNVTADEALAFCDWLTGTDRASGLLSTTQIYRLPTNEEWDAAVGSEPIPERSRPVTTGGQPRFPWGREWPPPRDSGNYNRARIDGADDDGFRFTAPVGKFQSSSEGLFDLGGNVSEWVLDPAPAGPPLTATLRGGSWMHFRKDLLASSSQIVVQAATRAPGIGFRCVLDDFAESMHSKDRQVADSRVQRARLLEKSKVSEEEVRSAVQQRSAQTAGARTTEIFIAVPGESFENSLNMKLLPLAMPGILLGEHEVRVGDYRRYLLDRTDSASMNPQFRAGFDHPVTGISSTEAEEFCLWLTGRERKLGSIPEGAAYRLPKLAEWRSAVMGREPDESARVFAWGSAWPPPADFANVESSETKPVKSYDANSAGFYDLAGNAAEWCRDTVGDDRAFAGGSWKSTSQGELRIDAVSRAPLDTRSPEIGFRIVLDFHRESKSAP